MEVTTQENSTRPVSRQFVRSGVAGNYEIIFEMIRIIRNSVNYDIGLKTLAANLLINKGYDSYTPAEKQLKVIYDFVTSNVEYIQDQAGLIESLKSARVTIADGYGDCDDLTNTIASLVGCIGFEDVRIVMARYFETDAAFVHTYPVVYIDDKRYVLDATLPDKRFNQEVNAIEIKEIPVFEAVKGLDGASGLFTNAKYLAKKFGRATIETLPIVADHLPLGFVAGKAFSTGAQLINQTAGKELSVNATASKINQELDKIIIGLRNQEIAFELAKSHALQVSAQLSAVDKGNDVHIWNVVRKSVQTRLDFINNFEAYAEANNLKVVHLNPTAMLCTGLAGASVGAYIIYQIWKQSKDRG